MSILDALASFVSGGGLTGIVGSVVGAVTQYKQRKMELAHEAKSWDFEVAMHRLESDSRREQMEAGLEIVREISAGASLQSAIAGDERTAGIALARSDMPWWVAAVRTLFRPWLTMLLLFAAIGLVFVDIPVGSTGEIVVVTITQGFAAMLGLWSGSRLVRVPTSDSYAR